MINHPANTAVSAIGSQQASDSAATPLLMIEAQFNNADALAMRVLALVERVAGHCVSEAKTEATSGAKGVLHELADVGRRTGQVVDRAHAAMSHLEGLL